ncbi:rhomboid family intramembrane serine protease GlpG [Thorsellia anophelis]|uniref:GlpG protein n=1 Tax=Thorsellia anophelis DSM 18579 TaxID=1123402 RepID=A0A1I0F3Q3_9GAMM|nr:rhomboid family intramembrane serine protease GlpG [Thorsellia anophelis]SET52647.1 GlpG protein [Thorsellia anophelis DSM 18579]
MQGHICVCVSSNQRFLLIFVDYILREYEVQLQIKQVNDAFSSEANFELWLPAQFAQFEEQVINAFTEYQLAPTHQKYLLASWGVGKTGHQFVKSQSKYSLIADLKMQARPLTLALLMLTVSIYILQQFEFFNINSLLFYPESNAQYSEFWRFISHAFLHFSLLHLVVNLMWLWYLGNQVELRLGALKLLSIFILSAALGGYGQNLTTGPYFGGLSGVVYALTGFCWLYGVMAPNKRIHLPTPILVFSVIWLLIGNATFLNLSLANTVHVVGLAVGLFMAFIDILWMKRYQQKS